jgi:alkylation response protein AidB-like acyl-CoA dehydrogenase
MVTGKWTGTMNLTEPQAGSDLALVRTRAEPQPDGTYKVFGTKIFITYGEHDMAENIVHLVLARVTGAPEGVKGISLFVVPKFMVNKDGSLGCAQRRALRQHRAQAGHQGLADGSAAVRRSRRRRRLPGGRGEPRPGVHVHHDECGPLCGGRAGHRDSPSGPTSTPWPMPRTASNRVPWMDRSTPAPPSSTTRTSSAC